MVIVHLGYPIDLRKETAFNLSQFGTVYLANKEPQGRRGARLEAPEGPKGSSDPADVAGVLGKCRCQFGSNQGLRDAPDERQHQKAHNSQQGPSRRHRVLRGMSSIYKISLGVIIQQP